MVTPGNHDGVHAGHRALVREARELAARIGPEDGGALAAASTSSPRVLALTFHPHPMQLVAPERAPSLLTTPERRVELLRGAGADEVVVRAFDAQFAQLSPEEFVSQVLIGDYGARAVVVGEDFRFGKNRSGDIDALRKFSARAGVQIVALPKVVMDGEAISSSRVRALLTSGEVERAAQLLTRIHDVTRTVIHGQARGRTIGTPTANLSLDGVLVPADGVYSVAVRILGDTPGPLLFGTANLGVRPTLGAGRSLEVHIHDFDADLYGQDVRVGFIARLRDERKFAGLDALRAQIANDLAASRTAALACQPELLSWM